MWFIEKWKEENLKIYNWASKYFLAFTLKSYSYNIYNEIFYGVNLWFYILFKYFEHIHQRPATSIVFILVIILPMVIKLLLWFDNDPSRISLSPPQETNYSFFREQPFFVIILMHLLLGIPYYHQEQPFVKQKVEFFISLERFCYSFVKCFSSYLFD